LFLGHFRQPPCGRTELATSFTFITLAETARNIGNHEHAERTLADEAKAYATIQRFLADPKHSTVSQRRRTPGIYGSNFGASEEAGRCKGDKGAEAARLSCVKIEAAENSRNVEESRRRFANRQELDEQKPRATLMDSYPPIVEASVSR